MYLYNSTRSKYLNYKDDGSLLFEGNKVWHAGNDGTGSGLDADLLDGQHLSDLDARYVLKAGDTMTGALTVPSLSVTGAATFSQAINGSILGNAATASRLQNARTISLTGSVTGSGTFDGSGNLSIATTTNYSHSAETLTTARTIWGQSFDGSANISGSMTGVTSINNTIYNIISVSTAGAGLKISEIDQTTNAIDLSVVNFSGGADGVRSLSLQSNGSTGKVGIGTTNPSHKLHTVGDTYSSTYVEAGTYLKSGTYTQATSYI